MWQRIPAVANQPDASELLTHRFNPFEHPHHWSPAELTVADIHHVELAASHVQWPFPRGIIGVKEKRNHVWSQRVQCWLADLVGNAVARVDPAAACGRIR